MAPSPEPARERDRVEVAWLQEDALEAALDGIAVLDQSMVLLYANPAFCRLHDCDDFEALSRRVDGVESLWETFIDELDWTRFQEEVLPLVTRAGSWSGRLRARNVHGYGFIAAMTVARTRSGGFVAVVRDATQEEQQQRALVEREALYRLVASNSTDLISLHDLDGRFVYASPSSMRLFGCSSEQMIGTIPWDSIHPEDLSVVQDTLQAAVEGRSGNVSYRARVRSGDWIWFETLVRPVRSTGERGEVDQLQCVSRDIHERKELEDQLAHQSLHDALTGLPNRRLFLDRLAQATARMARTDTSFAVAYLDVNGFKQINDSFGHAAGDELLARFAQRLVGAIRSTDTAARLSGDEFAVLLEGAATRADIDLLVPRIARAFDPGFDIAGQRLRVRPSIGVALAEGRDQSHEELLRLADQAMYAAKRLPGAGYFVHDADERLRKWSLQADFEQALETGGLHMVYQPIVESRASRVVGLEALLRWDHPELGPVFPGKVIQLAEQTCGSEALTRWIVERACADASRWSAIEGVEPPMLALNMTERELGSPTLPDLLEATLRVHGLTGEQVSVEVSPEALQGSAPDLVRVARAGVRVTLDHFGDQPIPLQALARSPITGIKIARRLVGSIDEPAGAAVAEAIVSLGASIGVEVSAQGVETQGQLERLRAMGYPRLQGYHLGRPVPAAEVPRLLLD